MEISTEVLRTGPLTLWRISFYLKLNGIGASINGGRWNSPGQPMVYLAETPAGAMLETLVHLPVDEVDFPEYYKLLRVEVPEGLELSSVVMADDSPLEEPLHRTRTLGDVWLSGRTSPLLRVPSAIMPFTWNVLINPYHLDSQNVSVVRDFTHIYDPRLLRARKSAAQRTQ